MTRAHQAPAANPADERACGDVRVARPLPSLVGNRGMGRVLGRTSSPPRRGAPAARAPRDDTKGSAVLRRAVLARQAAPPHYRDCVETVTGVPDADERLEAGRQRARGFVGAARRALANAPAAGSTYETALNRHFATPSDAERATILANFDQIAQTLRVNNYICNSNNICGDEQAFWIDADDLVHVCRPFWTLDTTCRAIVLIHEGAHDIGVDAAIADHTPNRGDAEYPTGNNPAPAGETAAGRIQNPDAYAFFAAHIWRGTDTSRTCF